MKTSKNRYLKMLLGLSFLTLIFHFLILTRVIPFDITWGGKLKDENEMYVFEIFSIAVNSFFIYVLLQKGNFVKSVFTEKSLSIILWVFFSIFVLNTIGNIFAETTFEKILTLVTLLNALLIWLLNRTTLR